MRLLNLADSLRNGLLSSADYVALQALVYPSIVQIDASSADPAAELQAALDAGEKRILLTGELSFARTVTMSGSAYSGAVILGGKGATIYVPQNADVAEDDNGELAWLRLVSPATSTPVPMTAAAMRGDYSITVSSAAGLSAGDWIRIDRGRLVTFSPGTGTLTTVSGEFSFASNQPVRLAAGDPIRNDQIATDLLPSAISALSGSSVGSSSLYAIPLSATTMQVSSAAGPGAPITGGTAGSGELWLAPQTTGDFYLQQDAATVQPKAVYQIASIAGNVLTLVQPISIPLMRGSTVQKIDLLSNVVLESIDFSPSIEGACPSGIRLESTVQTRLYGVTGAGFTRAAIDECWCRDATVEDAVHAGKSNALLLRHSSIGSLFANASTAKDVPLAVNARGIPRAMFMERHRAADNTVRDLRFLGGHCAGVRLVGSCCSDFRNIRVEFMNGSLLAERDPTLLYTGGTSYGVAEGLSGGIYIAAVYGEYWRQCDVSGLYLNGNVAPYYESSPPYRWSAQCIIGDCWGVMLDDVVIGNAGKDPTTAGAWQNGIAFFDAFNCTAGIVQTHGQYAGVIFYNANNARIQNLSTLEAAGVVNAGVGISGRSLTDENTNVIDFWTAGVTYPFVEEVASADELPLATLRINAATFLAQTASSIYLSQNQTGTTTSVGDVVQLSDDGAPNYNPIWITPTTADASKLGAVFGYGANNGAYMLVARLGDRRITAAAGAVNIGDKIVGTAASKQAAVDNAATLPILGISATRKAAGAPGIITVLEIP